MGRQKEDIKLNSYELSNAFNDLTIDMQQLEAMLWVQSGDSIDGWSDVTQAHYRQACVSMMLQARSSLDVMDGLIHG